MRGAAVLALAALLPAAPLGAQEIEVDRRIPWATRRALDIQLDTALAVIQGDTTIARGTTVAGPLVHLGGRLVLEGRVEGDVTGIDSDVLLRPGAEVEGDLLVVGGTFRGATQANVAGRSTWLRGEPVRVERPAPGVVRVAYVPPEVGFRFRPAGPWGIVVREYNGVDGLTAGLMARLEKPPEEPRTELVLGPLFHTARDDVGWEVRGLRELPRQRLVVGGSVHRVTETRQRWQRPDLGNTLLSLALADDDRAYYERTGYELWVERSYALPFVVGLRWRDDDHATLASREPFALFDDEGWPENPPAEEGRGRSFGMSLTVDRRDVPEFPTRGWWLRGEVDHWGFGGDFDFDRGEVEARTWLPLGGRSFAAVRLMAGGRLSGEVPPQLLWRLGGAGSLAGYDALIDPLVGDRMALANVRAHFALPGSVGGFETVWLVALADAGDAWSDGESADWHPGLGGGIAAHGDLRYLGVFAAHGVETGTWKLIVMARPWLR